KKIGTTGRGIGPAYADKMLRTTGIRVSDLLEPDHFREKLHHIVSMKNIMFKALADSAGLDWPMVDAEKLADSYLGFAEMLAPHIGDTTHLLHRAIADGKKLLFEGANGSMLDIDHGTYPYVTSSNCGSVGIY